MTLLQWRFGRSAPDMLSRPSSPTAGRQVMNSASFKPCSMAGSTMRPAVRAAGAQAAGVGGITHGAVSGLTASMIFLCTRQLRRNIDAPSASRISAC